MRIVIADDAVILREGLARILTEAGFEVVGLAGDGRALLALVEERRPDVAIVDIRMHPTHTNEGVVAAGEIRARFPEVGILVLSQHVRASYAIELFGERGERLGYLLKDRVGDLAELAAAIRRIAEGGSVLDPLVVAELVGRRRDDGVLAELTDREREVLALMAEGRSNQAIGQALVITQHTVEKHVRSILATLGLPPSADDHRRVLAVLAFLRARRDATG
jgi:DNA-binding NarL/FixJ family response regulator